MHHRLRKLQCYYGLFLWHYLVKKNPEIKNTAVILIPTVNDIDSYYALLYADQYVKNKRRDNAVILTHDSRINKVIGDFSDKIIKVIPFSRKKSEALMQYATLYDFDERLIIASLNEPKGRNGTSPVGVKGITEEEIFAVGVYGCFPFEKELPVSFPNSIFE